MEKREVIKRTLLLVITSNRGLCGGYNGAIIREAAAAMRKIESGRHKDSGEYLHLELSGKRVIAWCRYQGIPAQATYTHFEDKPQYAQVEELANKYIQLYISGQVDRVDVAYSKFINAARQMPVVETLLPFHPIPCADKKAGADDEGRIRISAQRQGHPGRDFAGVVQDSAFQMFPRRRRQRADRPPRRHESRHRKRRRHDQNR